MLVRKGKEEQWMEYLKCAMESAEAVEVPSVADVKTGQPGLRSLERQGDSLPFPTSAFGTKRASCWEWQGCKNQEKARMETLQVLGLPKYVQHKCVNPACGNSLKGRDTQSLRRTQSAYDKGRQPFAGCSGLSTTYGKTSKLGKVVTKIVSKLKLPNTLTQT